MVEVKSTNLVEVEAFTISKQNGDFLCSALTFLQQGVDLVPTRNSQELAAMSTVCLLTCFVFQLRFLAQRIITIHVIVVCVKLVLCDVSVF